MATQAENIHMCPDFICSATNVRVLPRQKMLQQQLLVQEFLTFLRLPQRS